MKLFSRPYLALIAFIGIIVPRHLRADWREEWEAELRYRERLLAEWDRLDWSNKWDLLAPAIRCACRRFKTSSRLDISAR